MRWSPSKQRYTAPAITTFHNILAALPPETLDNAIGQWKHSTAHAPVAMDGKDLRGASKQTEDGRRMMVAAVADSGNGAGRRRSAMKSNSRARTRAHPAALGARSAALGHRRCVSTTSQQDRRAACSGARARLRQRHRDNQETIAEDLKLSVDFSGTKPNDKGHIERRRCAAVDLSGAEWDGYANLHGRRQAMRIEREREILKTGKSSIEVTWSLTSLGKTAPFPRSFWPWSAHIENRLHYVRDFTYDEDFAGRMCVTCPAISPA